MDRRRLVKCPGDRLEIIGIECVWIKHAIPADHIERMMSQRVSSQSSAVLDEHGHVFLAVDNLGFAGAMKVALAVRSAKPNLTVRLKVACRDDHAAG